MTFWVSALLNSAVGRWCGVPPFTTLDRPQADQPEPFTGSVYLCGKASEYSTLLMQQLRQQGADIVSTLESAVGLSAIVFDGTELQHSAELDMLWQQLQPALPRLGKNGRLVLLASTVEDSLTAEAASAAAGLAGFTRSIAKELGRFGSSANLLSLHQGAQQSFLPVVEFFLSKASAYVTGQVLPVQPASNTAPPLWKHPLQGKIALVTGAARGIGSSIAATLTAQGATVIGLDIAQSESSLSVLMQQLQGKSLVLDVSQQQSAEMLCKWLTERQLKLDIVVHNAGITRDRVFHRMTQAQWQQTLDVNVRAVERINAALLEQHLINSGGRVVLLSSMNGLAGQKGQTNYASSKAALVGYCQFMAKHHQDMTFNAVAPGFIETQMTAAMPLLPREVGRRLNSFVQPGVPNDVALAVAFFARPDAGGLNGSVLRVCGQCIIGA